MSDLNNLFGDVSDSIDTKDSMSVSAYEQTGADVPYLNAVTFCPEKGQERTALDDKAILIDADPLPADTSVTERLRMSRSDFDKVFIRTMNYIREVESIAYKNVQKGVLSINDLDVMIKDYFKKNCPEILHPVDEKRLLQRLNTAIDGYYVLQPLIDNPDTSDIKVCGANDIRVRIKGKAYSSKSHFIDEYDLTNFVEGICLRNRVSFNNSPIVTFADNHDKNYILRFVVSAPEINAVDYPYLHIRKVSKQKLTFDDLTKLEEPFLTPNVRDYLINRAKVSKAIVISGPPGSGKTVALNAFIEYIPKTREALVLQENDELFTNQSGFMFKHVTHGFDGRPEYTLEDLGRMALVEGCNEFIIGEVKGAEMRNVMTLLRAGGYAALTTHSIDAESTLDRLADLVKYGSSYSYEDARRMLSAIDTIVYCEDFRITKILECRGYDDETHQFIYKTMYEYQKTA